MAKGAEKRQFRDRNELRRWFEGNHAADEGLWFVFGKKGGPQTIKPEEALEEALCFGWIDGHQKSVDEGTYMKYFSPRRPKSNWSEKNKGIVARLEQEGRMTEQGRLKIEAAKADGRWDTSKSKQNAVSEEQIGMLVEALQGREPALSNFCNMPPSARRTYTGLWLDAKTEETRNRRLEMIADRLHRNLKPMQKEK